MNDRHAPRSSPQGCMNSSTSPSWASITADMIGGEDFIWFEFIVDFYRSSVLGLSSADLNNLPTRILQMTPLRGQLFRRRCAARSFTGYSGQGRIKVFLSWS